MKPLPFPSQSDVDSDSNLNSHPNPILVFMEFEGYDNIKLRPFLIKKLLLLNNIPVVQINN